MNTLPTATQLTSIDFLHAINPELTISDFPFSSSDSLVSFKPEQEKMLVQQVKKDGYFQSDSIINSDVTKLLAKAIANLNEKKVLPIFIATYDEFWQMLHQLRKTFDNILGKEYLLTPDFWAWHIAPDASAGGWDPHRDEEITGAFSESTIRKDGSPRKCTVWVPLTDATTHNSCIHVMPFSKDNEVQSFIRGDDFATIQQNSLLTNFNIMGVRALPAASGSILGWSPYIFHWGGSSSEWASKPRISVGIYLESDEVESPDIRPFDQDGRKYIDWHNPQECLSPDQRLRIIGNLVDRYKSSGQFKNEKNMSDEVLKFSQLITKP